MQPADESCTCPAPVLIRDLGQIPALARRTGRWRYAPDWNGLPATLVVDRDERVDLRSRHGMSIRRAFPLTRLAAQPLPSDTVLDGEMMCWSADNHLDFGALHARALASAATARRLAVEHPAHFIVTDLVRLGGTDYSTHTIAQRHAHLQTLFDSLPAGSPLALGPQTDDEAVVKGWFTTLVPLGVAGIVAVPAVATYRLTECIYWRTNDWEDMRRGGRWKVSCDEDAV